MSIEDPAPRGDERDEGDELERVASWLEKITRDPMADAVAGRARVTAAPPPVARGRYQECAVELVVEADGIPETAVAMAVVFPRSVWPRVGDVLPARISRSNPQAVEVDWERLRRR